jgi:hypothetical protein
MARKRSSTYGKRAGNNFEREVAKKIAAQFKLDPEDVFRTPSSGGMDKKKFKGDVTVLNRYFPLHIEAKFGYDFELQDIAKKKYIEDFVYQAVSDEFAAGPHRKTPIVVIAKPYYDRYVIIPIGFAAIRDPEIVTESLQRLSFFMLTPKYAVVLLDELALAVELGIIITYA